MTKKAGANNQDEKCVSLPVVCKEKDKDITVVGVATDVVKLGLGIGIGTFVLSKIFGSNKK